MTAANAMTSAVIATLCGLQALRHAKPYILGEKIFVVTIVRRDTACLVRTETDKKLKLNQTCPLIHRVGCRITSSMK